MFKQLAAIFSISLTMLLTTAVWAEDLTDVNVIIKQATLAAYYQGEDGRSEARMVIEDSQGRKQQRQFTILRRDHEDGGDQQFLVVFSRPADVRNTVFLVEKHAQGDDDRWLYLPGLDLVKRISAGDKRTSFVGSHYFYEDVSGRNPDDDNHQLIESTGKYYLVENTPKDANSVEFSRYQVWIEKLSMLPVKIEYYDSSDKLYRRVEVLDTKEVQGVPTVTKSRVSDLISGASTTMEFRFIRYDMGMESTVFTERSLRNPPRQWLKRPE